MLIAISKRVGYNFKNVCISRNILKSKYTTWISFINIYKYQVSCIARTISLFSDSSIL